MQFKILLNEISAFAAITLSDFFCCIFKQDACEFFTEANIIFVLKQKEQLNSRYIKYPTARCIVS